MPESSGRFAPEPVIGDAFGRILERCAEAGAAAGSAFEIVERSDGFIAATDASKYFTTSADWPAQDSIACDLVKGRVLDIGCGAGRHAVELLERGYDVVGLEPSPRAADIARDRGVNVIGATVEDLTPALAGEFDTFLMLGNNMGLLGSTERAAVVLDAMAAAAAPGARILAAGTDPYAGAAPEHAAYHDRNRAAGRMGGQLTLRVRDRELATDWFDYLLVTPDELVALLDDSPWCVDEIHPGDGNGYLAVLGLR